MEEWASYKTKVKQTLPTASFNRMTKKLKRQLGIFFDENRKQALLLQFDLQVCKPLANLFTSDPEGDSY